MTPPRWFAGADARRTALRVAVLVLWTYIIFGYVIMPVRGVGISMSPTIESGDLVFINRLAYRFREPRRGDIVAVRMAGRSTVYVKRLLALPGERLKMDGGIISVDDFPIPEPYAQTREDWGLAPVTLGPDQYFVVGDNRIMRQAEHEMGTVSRARLIGPAIGR